MVSSLLSLLFSLLALLCFQCESALPPPPPPKSLIFPISKTDSTDHQHYTTFQMGTNRTNINATIDLGGQFVWFDCESYHSKSYHPISCRKPQCKVAPAWTCSECPVKECRKNTCGVYTYNPFVDSSSYALLNEDTMKVTSTDGVKSMLSYDSPQFSFTCADNFLLGGLASGTNGLVGLGRTKTSLHSQLASSFKLPHKFAICLPSSNKNGPGSLIIGGGPYYMPLLTEDMSKSFFSTPVIVNPVSNATVHREGEASNEYFIDVKSIKIDGKVVSFSLSLLAIDKNGFGGTKIGTRTPYTVLQSPIYKPLVSAFAKAAEAMKIKRVKSVAPFGACFSRGSINDDSKTGPVVPNIDLELKGNNAVWRIHGSNSMVQSTKKNVVCIGFVEGGFIHGSTEQRTSIVLGTHQLENQLLEFDSVESKLGFTSSLLLQNTTCSHFRAS